LFGIYYFNPCTVLPTNSTTYASFLQSVPAGTTNLSMRIIDDSGANITLSNYVKLVQADFKT
jgi:hypothetical protein